MMLRASDIALLAGGVLQGEDVAVDGVSADTRTLNAGALFVALQGPNFDGHDFLAEARERGAAAALVSRGPVGAALTSIVVDDTRLALGRLAAGWRARYRIPLVAVTGSNGKTTVKEMIASILARCGTVLATTGNLNNDIGVPLTLLRLRAEHRYAVIEMGANHGGEIAYVAQLAQPTIGVVTNAGNAHLEGFGSAEGVARGKGELFQALSSEGVAVLNADDRFAGMWAEMIGARRTLRFGLERPADLSVVAGSERMEVGEGLATHFTLRMPGGELSLRLQLSGRHNVLNACAAAAAALAAGVGGEEIREGLAALAPVKGRLQLKLAAPGLRVLDDTYNANPSSLRAALQVLSLVPGRRWLVLGDMAELGGNAAELHAEMAEAAHLAGVEQLYSVGVLTRYTAERFGAGARHFPAQEALIAALREDLRGAAALPITILVKGSRRMAMERVVAALAEGQPI